MISREIINKNIIYRKFVIAEKYDYNALCEKINQAKNVLIDHGVQRESLVTVIDLTVTINYLAFVFATLELGCVLHTPNDDMWSENTRYDMLNSFQEYALRTDKWKMTSAFVVSALDEEIASGVKKIDVDGFFGRDLMRLLPQEHISFSKIDEYGSEPNQPWEVYPDTLCCMTTSDWNKGVGWMPKFHTHEEVLNKSKRVIDIFCYKDKNVGLTKNHGHMSALELLIIPSMMSAKGVFELPLLDKDYGGTMSVILPIIERSLIRDKIDVLFGFDDKIHHSIKIPSTTKVLRYDEHVYGDMKSLPKLL
jgi:hypothetical protein